MTEFPDRPRDTDTGPVDRRQQEELSRPEVAEESPDGGDLVERLTEEVEEALDQLQFDRVEALADTLHAADLAAILNRLHPDDRRTVVGILRDHMTTDGEVLAYLADDVREEVLDLLEPEEIAAAVAELDSDDALSLIEDLDEEEQEKVLASLPVRDRLQLVEGLSFPEYSAGRLMQREVVAVPQFWTVGKVIDWMREAEDLPDDFHVVFTVDPMHRPVGAAPVSRVLRAKRSMKVQDCVSEEFRVLSATMDQEEVAHLFRKYGLVSAPVVDSAGRLIGVVTVDDVVDVIDEEASDDLLRMGGVAGETDIYRDVRETTQSRFSWLFVNLLTAILASIVIGLFEEQIARLVALAVLMPIVASMGGNAGTQALTVAVRAIATKELTDSNALRVVLKEVLVGLANGVMFAVLTGVVIWAWFQDLWLALVFGLAMIVNLVAAGFSGALIPIVLNRLRIDPAVSSSVFLTTVTDVVGFFAFLGLAAVVLL